MIAKLLWDRTGRGIDPFSHYNPLIFMIGPITGLWGGGQTCVGFKAPETGTIGHALTGGQWGAELRHAGYSGIFLTGKADSPSYVSIRDDDVEIRDAQHLWGKGVTENERALKEEVGDKLSRVVSCGPAGERLIRTSSILQESWRAAARGGPGALMGSKNLKAIVVRGTKGVDLKDPKTCFRLGKEFTGRLAKIGTALGEYGGRRFGTTTATLLCADSGLMTVKNQQEGDWKELDKTGGVRLERRNGIYRASCHGCPVGCLHLALVRSGSYAGTVSQIDFDSSGTLGPNCLVTDIDGLMYLNALCDELGIDSESMGYIISWVMECVEKGILSQNDLGDIDLQWGNVPAMVKLIMKIVKREGIGDLLAEGLGKAVDTVGKGSAGFAMHSKGMGFGGWHAVQPARGLQYAIGDRGGCHHYGTSLDEQNWRAWCDSITSCSYHRMAVGFDYVKLASAATGLNFGESREEWDKTAERILLLSRAYNIREGMKPLRDDILPERTHTEPLTYGKGMGKVYSKTDFEKNRADWYRSRGCDENGVPTREHLKELDLEFAISDLDEAGAFQ
jgi:aldehyde:ferredoxin oxidoreductase